MQNKLSGSIDSAINELVELVANATMEDDLANAFGEKYYFLNDKIPDPFWVYSQSVHSMVLLKKYADVIVLDDYDVSQPSTNCFISQNIVSIPTVYITETTWN